jgi:hypothetical protein
VLCCVVAGSHIAVLGSNGVDAFSEGLRDPLLAEDDHVAHDGTGGCAKHRLGPPTSLTSQDWSTPGARHGERRQIQPLQVLKQPPAQIGHHDRASLWFIVSVEITN